jgi:LytS/YehU family sensor histidine kinase
MGAASLCSGVLLLFLFQAWNALNLLAGVDWAGMAVAPTLAVLIVGAGAMLYGLAVAVFYLLSEFVRAQAAERHGLEAQLAAQQAELRLLRAQIDPHFLFNSLNSISALTTIAPASARDMTLRLAAFFRRSLGLEAQGQVTLSEEMALVGDFLAIEKVRFGERLAVEEVIDATTADCLLPPMLIQPLVENAVKHGIRHLVEGGVVRIAATRTGSQLRIAVSNGVDRDAAGDGNGNGKEEGTGLGLANVRQRLAAAYGHEASLHWRREADTFVVELTLPATTKAASVAPSTQGENA